MSAPGQLHRELHQLRQENKSLTARLAREQATRALFERAENRVRSVLFFIRDHHPDLRDYIDKILKEARYTDECDETELLRGADDLSGVR